MMTLQPRPAKILEQIVKSNITHNLNHYSNSNLTKAFGSQKHGFRKYHSTTTAIIDIMDHLKLSLDNKDFTGAALLIFDLSRAFHTINHSLLIHKLENLFPPLVGSLATELLTGSNSENKSTRFFVVTYLYR